jgi:hypothetical protein
VSQRLAETRDEQECVVGRGADHQDEEDPLGLPAEQQDVPFREPPHHQQRHAEGEEARREHDEGQKCRAVHEHEDHEHGTERDAEQEAVDTREAGYEVGGEAGGTGDLHRHAVGGVRAERLAEFGDVVGRIERDECLHREAVVGKQRG